VALSAEFTDPRLVAVYDTLNPYSPGTQPDFYLELAREVDATSLIEIGCGTGLVTAKLAGAGFDVVGLEPSERMLEVARRRPRAGRVRWIHGGVGALDVREADLAFMAGHVAQFFLTDDAWCEALTAIHAALRPDGLLAFESRNPSARAWQAWTPTATRRTAADPGVGEIETWTEVGDAADGMVTTVNHYRFAASGQELTARAVLRFRTAEELEASLRAAGFVVRRCYGGWDRRPFTGLDDEIILVAHRT
jgi:SAM-dependent methyltransferase